LYDLSGYKTLQQESFNLIIFEISD